MHELHFSPSCWLMGEICTSTPPCRSLSQYPFAAQQQLFDYLILRYLPELLLHRVVALMERSRVSMISYLHGYFPSCRKFSARFVRFIF